jgi:hypothetical protein
MSWLYSQALVGAYLGENFSDGEQSAPLNGKFIQQAYCAPDKMTDFSRLSRFGMTYKPLTDIPGEELLTLYLEGFHARTSAPQEKAQELMESDQECGEKWLASFVKYDPDTSLWRTHQCSLLGDLELFLETWPQWGLMRDGECWEQMPLEPITSATEFGLLVNFPTPTVGMVTGGQNPEKGGQVGLGYMARKNKWPTPRTAGMCGGTGSWELLNKNTTKEEARLMGAGNGGKLNPTWVEWLMGWPLGWTDLKPLGMGKFPCAPQQHGES